VDFGVNEWHGHNVFFRDGERVFRTYFINNRGDEAMGSTWSYLDITPLGRQETWEDSPEGYPQTPPYKSIANLRAGTSEPMKNPSQPKCSPASSSGRADCLSNLSKRHALLVNGLAQIYRNTILL